MAGIVFGLVQMALEGYIYYPLQIILDYPLAFACLGLAGLFKKQPLIGVVVALTGRFLSHFVSGVVFFAEYAPPEMGPYVYSAVYNGSYILGEMVISGIIIYLIYGNGCHSCLTRSQNPILFFSFTSRVVAMTLYLRGLPCCRCQLYP